MKLGGINAQIGLVRNADHGKEKEVPKLEADEGLKEVRRTTEMCLDHCLDKDKLTLFLENMKQGAYVLCGSHEPNHFDLIYNDGLAIVGKSLFFSDESDFSARIALVLEELKLSRGYDKWASIEVFLEAYAQMKECIFTKFSSCTFAAFKSLLNKNEEGSFIIRPSPTKPGQFLLYFHKTADIKYFSITEKGAFEIGHSTFETFEELRKAYKLTTPLSHEEIEELQAEIKKTRTKN